MLIRLSRVVVIVKGGTNTNAGLLRAQELSCDGTIEYLEVPLHPQQVSCDGTLESILRYQR